MKIQFSNLLIILYIFTLTSCYPAYITQKQPIDISESSKFSKINLLDWTKDDVFSKYGNPINTGIQKEGTVTIEDLYYAEVIQGIVIVTKIIVKEGVVVKKEVSQISPTNEERLKRIEKQLFQIDNRPIK